MRVPRYGIAEWYGRPFVSLSPAERQQFAELALKEDVSIQPPCPFQHGQPICSKRGGVCSMQRYEDADGRIGEPVSAPTALCPRRFEEGQLLVRWLCEIVGFSPDEAMVAREVPFMASTGTAKPAGKIDLVVAKVDGTALDWYGLEIQAVYFSGKKMAFQFRALLSDQQERPPFPDLPRRPDWRSSSAKRLMPQLEVKVPTLRMWGSKMAVAVDRTFFDAIGGPSASPAQYTQGGDIFWLVPELRPTASGFTLARSHWEALSLEDSADKLLSAEHVTPHDFEEALRARLRPLDE